jgi:excisionase family DNA binding protein
MESKVYTLREAAQLTRLSLDAVRDAAKAGGIPAIKPGGKWLILKDPLDRMLRGEKAAPTAP